MSKNFVKDLEQTQFVQNGKRSIFRLIFGRTMVILLGLVIQFILLFAILLSLVQNVPYLFGGVMVFTAVMLIYILNTQDNPSIKLSWCIVIAILPVFGTMLYFFVNMEVGHRAANKIYEKTMEDTQKFMPDQSELLEQVRQEDKNLYNLAHYLSAHGGHAIYGNTKVKYFPLGEDKFAEMLKQMESAEKYIFLEYFILAPSYMWDRVLDVLIRKAKQGVDVRVMYDGSCAVTYLPYNYPKELEKQGIKCKMLSPFLPLVSTHYNNRDHRKILVIDGHTAFTGGVNLDDRYINREEVFGHWKDTAVMLQGDAARGFTLMFLQMWNALEKEPIYEPYLIAPGPVSSADGYVIPYGDSPTDNENVGEMVYLNMLNQAQDYVYIMTPYLILDNEMVTALRFAAKRGVDVRLIHPHIPDHKYTFALAKGHYKELIEAGVKVYEYTPGFVHAKVFLCDDREAVVGTINLDYRSLYLHYECAAYLYKVPALKDIRADFEDTISKSELVTMDAVRKRSLFSRLIGAILKVMAPLM